MQRHQENGSKHASTTGTHEPKPRSPGDEVAVFGDLARDYQVRAVLALRLPQELIDRQNAFGDLLNDLAAEARVIADRIARIEQGLADLQTLERALADLQEKNRSLSESFYEREVLGPALRTLVSMVDRRRRALAGMEVDDCSGEIVRADLVELENELARFGVEPYECVGDCFDPSSQSCLKRVPIEASDMHGRIAERLLPGFRRGPKLLRPEGVAVYVYAVSSEKPKGPEGTPCLV